MPASTARWVRSPTAPALFSPSVDAAEYGSRFHGHNERIDIESLALTTRFWHHVTTDLLT